MTPLKCGLLALAFTFGFPASAWCYDLGGKWTLIVEDKKHHVVTTLDIKFTNQSGQSCMSGNWMRVAVEAATTKDANFFPASDPLSFSVENDKLTIGRNQICDAYLMLTGTLNDKTIRGEYYALGLGGTEPLGFFTLSREK
jgi:hypothetical protein